MSPNDERIENILSTFTCLTLRKVLLFVYECYESQCCLLEMCV